MKAEEITSVVRARQERDRGVLAVEQLRGKSAKAHAAAEQAEGLAVTARDDRERVHSAWSVWKAERRCPEALRPETAQQFFASVERLRESLIRTDGIESEVGAILEQIRVFTGLVKHAFESAGDVPQLRAVPAEDAIGLLRERVETDAQLRAEIARLTQELEKARASLARAVRAFRTAEATLNAALGEADASDESTCRVRIATSRRRAELRRRIQEAEHRLRVRLGTGAKADAVRLELASGNRQGWDTRRQECKATLVRLQPAYEEALRHHQTAVEASTALEHECDVVALATEREGVVAEIREALSEWRLLAIAHSLVQGTLRRYEIERQPAVLTSAAKGFSRVTDGRYTRLATRENGIDVLGSDGSRLDAAALSRGTAEQLYLCLRLALASEFGRLSVPLPLVMDDVLVNFDPERAALAAQVVLEATAGNQILLFTCHPETVELLRGLDTNVRLIEIPRQLSVARYATPVETGSRPDGNATAAANFARDSSPPAEDLAAAVLTSIRAAGRPLSRATILTATGLPEPRWMPVIQSLRNRGLVVPHGRRRGTTWGLPEWGGQPDEDE